MQNREFNLPSFLDHTLAYFKALSKKYALQVGDMANKGIKTGIVIGVVFVVAPLVFLLLFVALAFGFHEWFAWSFALSFAIVAISALLIGVVITPIVIVASRNFRAKILTQLMQLVDNLNKDPRISKRTSTPKQDAPPHLPNAFLQRDEKASPDEETINLQ